LPRRATPHGKPGFAAGVAICKPGCTGGISLFQQQLRVAGGYQPWQGQLGLEEKPI
jgi:hypothetical protein